MNLESILLDLGNILFFVATFPQLRKTYKYRNNPETLEGVSMYTFIGFILATICFILAGFLIGGILTVILGIINIMTFALQLYWKLRLR